VRPVFAGSIKPVLLLGEAPASAPAPQPSGAADSYRASMLREAMPPVRAEMVTIQAMASGDERARATRRLLAKYHPSQAGAVVQNPALQWLFSEITKEISQSLSNLR
jgi:energy-coupling factor transporter ATP-binding protein EcfA2